MTGSAWGDWANYADSPLRAFENELGVQAQMGDIGSRDPWENLGRRSCSGQGLVLFGNHSGLAGCGKMIILLSVTPYKAKGFVVGNWWF